MYWRAPRTPPLWQCSLSLMRPAASPEQPIRCDWLIAHALHQNTPMAQHLSLIDSDQGLSNVPQAWIAVQLRAKFVDAYLSQEVCKSLHPMQGLRLRGLLLHRISPTRCGRAWSSTRALWPQSGPSMPLALSTMLAA